MGQKPKGRSWSKNYENGNIFCSRETRLKNDQFIHNIRELWTFVGPFVIDKMWLQFKRVNKIHVLFLLHIFTAFSECVCFYVCKITCPQILEKTYLDLKDTKIKLYDPLVSKMNFDNNWIILTNVS
jgi:hypothetical protein